MNTTDENNPPATIDDYNDHLIDRGLAELIGNDAPPNLSGQILSAAAATMPEPAEHSISKRSSTSRWLAAAVAASLLLGGTFLIWPGGHSVRKAAMKNSAQNFNLEGIPSQFTAPSGLPTNFSDSPAPAVPTSGMRRLGTTADRFSVAESAAKQSFLSVTDGRPNEISGLNDAIQELRTPALTPGFKKAHQSELSASTDAVHIESIRQQHVALGIEGGYGRGTEQLAVRGELEGAVAGRFDGERDGYGLELAKETAAGTGPDLSGDQYTRIAENPFIKAEGANAVSTFSIDVDTASYANVRQFLLGTNALPPPDAVRIEELINYFDYDYAGPNAEDEAPFASHVEVAGCPWKPEHRLVRIGIKGRELDRDQRPKSNLVFLVDVSGSMDEPNKLPLVVYGLEQLTRELGENDRVAIVVYASSEGLVLPSTPGSQQKSILGALGQLRAGGSTAGGAGIQLAYQIAEDNFLEGSTNRVILCTDGDFNVGVTSTAELERLCEQKAKDTGVFLSVLGFGRGNLNDAMMEAIADHGNGNYHYVDNSTEARRVLVEEMTGTLVTIAKDVKIQVEFNPRQVAGYRLIGYENRMLRTEDFNDDTKDAGEIGAGHTVTALYEVVPAGQAVDVPPVDELKYQPAVEAAATDDATKSDGKVANAASELLLLKMRYKQPDGQTSRKLDWAVTDEGKAFRAASGDFQFASAVAGFGLLLRDSQHKGNLTFAAVIELAQSGIGHDEHGHRAEFLEIVRRAQTLRGE